MPCPVCNKPPVENNAPFCSARCRQIDLGHWFSGTYAIPAEMDKDEDIPNINQLDNGES